MMKPLRRRGKKKLPFLKTPRQKSPPPRPTTARVPTPRKPPRKTRSPSNFWTRSKSLPNSPTPCGRDFRTTR